MDRPVLRFDRSDQKGSFVLVQVGRNGTRILDVKFIGTEGACAYGLACMSGLDRLYLQLEAVHACTDACGQCARPESATSKSRMHPAPTTNG